MWGAAEPTDLERAWAEGLWEFEAVDLRDALAVVGQNYPDYPPTLPQFIGLCRDARRRRAQQTVRLSAPRDPADHYLAERAVAAVGRLKRDDPKAWARRILERDGNGEPVPMYAVTCAREALGL